MTARIVGSGLPDTKALSVDTFFDYMEMVTDEPTREKMYKTVGWVFRCIELRANALSAVPVAVMRGETELEARLELELEVAVRCGELKAFVAVARLDPRPGGVLAGRCGTQTRRNPDPVSYTHLTLPTN